MDSDFFINSETLTVFFALIAIVVVFYFLWKFLRKSIGNGNFSQTPILNSFSRDLTEMAQKNSIDPVVGREKEIKHLITVLSKRTKNNAVLIGEAGVGKTTIVEGLAQKIFSKNIPMELCGKRVLALDLNALLSGTKYRGEFEGRVKKITEEVTNTKRNIILFIDEIHNLIESEGSSGSVSVGDIFKPAMARGDLQIIGATTKAEYDEYFHKDMAFKRRLQPIFVDEPDKIETLSILKGIRSKYENYHKVKISDEVLQACIDQSERMLPDRSFPDKAIDLMDEASSKTRMECIVDEKVECQIVPEVKIEDVHKIAEEYKEVKS